MDVLEISNNKKLKKKLTSLCKSLSNFQEKYIWMSCSVVKLQATILLVNKLLHMYISRIMPIFSE